MADDTELVQGYFDRGEPLPPGEYRISRPIHFGQATLNPESVEMLLQQAAEPPSR